MRLAPSLLALLLASTAAAAQTPAIGVATPSLETRNLPDNARDADGDDPAVWVAPGDKADSLVVTAVKNGGIRVYDLAGALKQVINPVTTPDRDGRINNVDVAYGLELRDGRKIDVAVASDRGLDVIRIYRIDASLPAPLVEITSKKQGRAFPQRPLADGTGLQDNPLDDQNTAYGLTLWKPKGTSGVSAIVTQRGEPRLGVFRLVPLPDGTVEAVYRYDYRVPVVHDGQNLREENDDPRRDWSPQFEGLAVDQRFGILYAGQEDVGIWRVNLLSGTSAQPSLVYETRGSTSSTFTTPSSVISRDVEGLCIYYGPGETGYLIASSQGGAHGDAPAPDAPYDDSFAVFSLNARNNPKLVGSFRIGPSAPIDGVQESDGADMLSAGLPGFENGLFVTQDGYNNDTFSGEPSRTNFKFVDWARIARSFTPPLAITPRASDPRLGR